MVADGEVLARLRALLAEADLNTATERGLRKELEADLGCSLADRKALIREEVQQYLEQQASASGPAADFSPDPAEGHGGAAQPVEDALHAEARPADVEEEEDGGDEEDAQPSVKEKRRRKGNVGFGCNLSEDMQQFLGVETMPRTEVVKKLWEYIKANNLQDPSNKRKILLDEKFSRLFTAPLNMLSMNKQLSRHCYAADRRGQDLDGENGVYIPKPAKPKAKVRKRVADGDDGQPKKKNGFTKELQISPELAEWTGRRTISRPELTTFFWKYIKDNNLQNPANKQEVLSDSTLLALTGQKMFKAFGFSKFLSKHLHGYADAA